MIHVLYLTKDCKLATLGDTAPDAVMILVLSSSRSLYVMTSIIKYKVNCCNNDTCY